MRCTTVNAKVGLLMCYARRVSIVSGHWNTECGPASAATREPRSPSAATTHSAWLTRSATEIFRAIARYVRETHTLSLEDAIRKMTSWPATRTRIADRGLLHEGL
jgi:hypothetical protein